jgi:tRNA(fMet)-specific endonuclease VapC
MTKFLLDTNIVSYFIKGTSQTLNQKILNIPLELYCTNWTVMQELYFGVFKAGRMDLELRYNQFFENCNVLLLDEKVILTCAKIEAHLVNKGKIIELEDVWIAATCIVHDLILITNNTKDFENIPELHYEDWTK